MYCMHKVQLCKSVMQVNHPVPTWLTACNLWMIYYQNKTFKDLHLRGKFFFPFYGFKNQAITDIPEMFLIYSSSL